MRTLIGTAFVVLAVLHGVSIYAQPSDPSVWAVAPTGSATPGCMPRDSSPTFSVAKIELDDDGSLANPRQLDAALDCIRMARQSQNGAIVVTFIHGWTHNAAWYPATGLGDEHFKNFRVILQSLTWREAERGHAGRRVVGIYFGWPGDARKGLGRLSGPLSFWNRYAAADRIGRGPDLRRAFRKVILATKSAALPDSPLMLAGHSMGAMILELSMRELIRNDLPLLTRPANESPGYAYVLAKRKPVLFPDAVMLLNSAADARLARELTQEIAAARLHRVVSCGSTEAYEAPLILSATAVDDHATGRLFRYARPGRRTEGHDARIATHALRTEGFANCRPRNPHLTFDVDEKNADFGQSWHCLRTPVVENGVVTSLVVDLPDPVDPRDRHIRHRLSPLPANSGPFWIFQVPTEVSGAHSDIFNARSNSLMMGFAQAAGAIMSLADRCENTFEPD